MWKIEKKITKLTELNYSYLFVETYHKYKTELIRTAENTLKIIKFNFNNYLS